MVNFSRRQALYGLGAGLGSVAFSAMLAADERAAAGDRFRPRSRI